MKRLQTAILAFFFTLGLFTGASSAMAVSTIFPDPRNNDGETYTDQECEAIILGSFENPENMKNIIASGGSGADLILGCAIQSGRVKFWMVPFFVKRVLEFLIQISSLISMLMILVGSYFYIAGGLTDDKEKGKTIISYAIGGLVLVILSWSLVSLLLLALTA